MAKAKKAASPLARTIDARRQELGLSLNALAKKVGVSHVTLVHIRNGRNDPRMETLRKIAKALGVTPAELSR